MIWSKATYDGFIPPLYLNTFSGNREGVIVEGNRINIDKEHYLKYDGKDVCLPTGTPVMVKLNRWFWFMSKDDFDKLQLQKEEERQRQEEDYRLKSITRREEAEQFNSEFNFPFEWEIGVKAVLSGLTERSMGNGLYQNTVHHIYLKNSVNIDRVKRNAGDFLCTSKGGNNGHFAELRTEEYFQDAEGAIYKPKITCKSCLKIAERWRAHEI
ncbi:hypothetical protein EHV15_35860 [Paenibacillus oralis]|uniref:Uncharacterized protein n=1 Tax=Paenibacillus oralis TaxID=2490856 RepID=A0A3P3TBQ5_9BACL|nr:hypothetical protein [Paenibacillus oralis]RRJ54949.1 hypothetical protein EHV15_35860 [Paenibacillus oralis]